MMNPEIRDQWATALESGEYRQCKGTLTRVADDGTEAHCCLGVLTELAVKAEEAKRDELISPEQSYISYNDGVADLPPFPVREWAGLAEGNPAVNCQGNPFRLAELNDSTGLTFTEIAAIIREQL
jgi:hypothetical protein